MELLTITVQIVFSKYFRQGYGCEVVRITDGIQNNFKIVFPIYRVRLAVFRPFGKDMSHRYVGDNIIPPFITCPVGLYMNGELYNLEV
jgi:hypothetical protein